MNDFPCPNCGARCFPNETDCPTCDVNLNETTAEVEHGTVQPKYPALRAIATTYQIFAVAIAVVTVLVIIVALPQSGLIAIVCLVVGLAAVLSFFAVSERIKVFVDIERNTRTIVALLDRRDAGDDKG